MLFTYLLTWIYPFILLTWLDFSVVEQPLPSLEKPHWVVLRRAGCSMWSRVQTAEAEDPCQGGSPRLSHTHKCTENGQKAVSKHLAPEHLNQPASWAVWHRSWRGKISPAGVGEKEISVDSHHKGQTALLKCCPKSTLPVRNSINMLKIRREHKRIIYYLQEKTKSICILFKFWFIALKWFPKTWS